MAKLGATDPRWIVADRPDGMNVNQWHWDQKDKTKVCDARIKELFLDRVLYENEKFVVESKNMFEFEGDVTIANRKGKRRCFFEMKMTFKYEVRPVKGCADSTPQDPIVPFEGKLHILDCDTQNYVEEFDITVSSDGDGVGKKGYDDALKAVQTYGRAAVRDILRNFIEAELMAANGCDSAPMQVKSESTFMSSSPSSSAATTTPTTTTTTTTTSSSSSSTLNDITFQLTWSASLHDIWSCFVQEDKISGYTRAPCTMKARVCGDFTMLSGAIKGTIVELVEKKKLVMKWRLSSWKDTEGLDSLVTITLSGVDGAVVMDFVHTGVPVSEIDRVRQGWEVNFWEGMKKILGYSHQ